MKSFFDHVTHGPRPWPVGREDLHWHFLPDPHQLAQELFEPYCELTHRQGLVPVQTSWYHMTIQHGPSMQDLGDDEVSEIIKLVRRNCVTVKPFDMIVDRPTIGNVAIECPMRPGKPAFRLRQITTAATRRVLGDRVAIIPQLFYPHISIAYAVSDVPYQPLKAWLSDCPQDPFAVRVNQISLVAQSHDGREITWRHLLDVPLAGTASAPAR